MKVLIDVFVSSERREYEVKVSPYGTTANLMPTHRDDPRITVNMTDLENAYRAVRDSIEG